MQKRNKFHNHSTHMKYLLWKGTLLLSFRNKWSEIKNRHSKFIKKLSFTCLFEYFFSFAIIYDIRHCATVLCTTTHSTQTKPLYIRNTKPYKFGNWNLWRLDTQLPSGRSSVTNPTLIPKTIIFTCDVPCLRRHVHIIHGDFISRPCNKFNV